MSADAVDDALLLRRLLAEQRALHEQRESELVEQNRVLKRDRERLRLLVENTTDVVSSATNQGVLTWVSDSVERLLGWTPQELIGHELREIVHPDDYEALVSGLPALLRGEPTRAEIRVRDAAGGYRWIDLRRSQMFDEAGNPAYRVGGWRDITAEHDTREALAQSRDFVRALLDAMLEPFVLFAAVRDDAGRVVDFVFADANPAALATYPIPRDEIIGSSLTALHPATRTTGLFDLLVEVVDRGVPLVLDEYSYPWELRTGPERRIDIRAVRVGDAVLQVWRDVTSRFEAARELERMALYDGLTGALNHSAALRRLDTALHDGRLPGDDVVVLFCDTDMFKDVNDAFGHAAGDLVLVELTRRLQTAIRSTDLLARMGGDEFLIVLTGVHGCDEALVLAEKLRRAAEEPITIGSRDVRVSLSIGVALARHDDTLDELLERADFAMYEAKNAGRNCVRCSE